MKLVIDIPVDDYKRIVKEGMTVFGSDYDIALLERALERGIPVNDFGVRPLILQNIENEVNNETEGN